MVEIARKKYRPDICPFWRKVSIIQQEKGCTMVVLCGRKKEESRLPSLTDFRRRRRCPLFDKKAVTWSFVAPAIYKQTFADQELTIPTTSLTIVRVGLESGSEGIKDLENRWEQELEKIR